MTDIFSMSIGSEALRLLQEELPWQVLTCFKRSLYLENPSGQVVCLAHSSLGPGPLNILVDIDLPQGGFSSLVTAPSYVSIAADTDRLSLKFPGLGTIHLSRTTVWEPEPFPAVEGSQLMRGVDIALAELQSSAPGNALIALFFEESRDRAAAVDKTLLKKVKVAQHHIIAWLRSALLMPGKETPPKELKALIGLGIGLTPSGDDFLCGVMIALHALGCSVLAEILAKDLLSEAQLGTNSVSLAHLRCAAKGFGGATIHETLNCLIEGGHGLSLSALSEIGHTSGWDAFAGILTVANSYLHSICGNELQ